MTNIDKERVAQLLEALERDFLADTHEENKEDYGFAYMHERIEELADLTNDEFTGKAIVSLADAHYEHSTVAQVFYSEQVALLRRERGEL